MDKITRKRSGSNERLKDFLRSVAYIGPSVLGVLVFFIIPFGVVVYYSIVRSPLDPEFVFLDNFLALLKNSAFITAAKNTLSFSAVAVPLAVVLSMGLALMLESRIPLKSQFRTFFLSPMMVPVASIVLIWQVVFHYNGALNGFLLTFGMDKIDWMKSEYSQLVVITLFLWKNLGYNMILFMAALANIPRELLEVADVEGASELYKFFAIKLRYLSPTVLFVTILSLINSFKVFREVYLLTGDYPYETLYMLQHFMNNTFKSLDYQKLSAAAVLMAIVMVVIIAILFKVEDWFGKDVEG
ncbi:MAG TPA: sugar ABC transporter permease [Clostridiales bacterium]|nr:sugar ABC transporter permease [Clostridiales bacterium]